jgi:hemolysin activation/secretion protein
MPAGAEFRIFGAQAFMTGRIATPCLRPVRPIAVLALACVVAGLARPAAAQTQQIRSYRPDATTQDRFFQASPVPAGPDRAPKADVGVPTLHGQPAARPSLALPPFRLRGIAVQGAASIPAEEITALYAERVGTMVTLDDIAAIAEQITALYRQAGFHLSRAIVPAQDIGNGQIRIDVIEGSIVEVVVRGPEKEMPVVRKVLAPITAEQPSRKATLERSLLNVNDLPGYRVTDTTLEEIGDASGRFRLFLTVEAWKIYWSQGMDNFGSAAVGPIQAYTTLALNSVLVGGDTLAAAASGVPDDLNSMSFGRLVYDMPVGVDGARIGVSALQSAVRPADTRFIHDTTRTTTFELRGSILPLQTRTASLRLTAAFGASNISEGSDFGTIYTDRIRTISLAADYRLKDDWNGFNFLTIVLRQGLDVAGASRQYDITNSLWFASGDFTTLNLAYTRLHKFSDVWSVKFSGTAQFASQSLLLSQQYFLGGAAFGPGYYVGDNGFGGSLELRWDQEAKWDMLKGYQVYGFVDGGQVWSVHGTDFAALASVGAGARFFMTDQLQAGVSVAFPVYSRYDNGELANYRILFSVLNAFKMCPSRPDLLCG